jgi:hypothetical protein
MALGSTCWGPCSMGRFRMASFVAAFVFRLGFSAFSLKFELLLRVQGRISCSLRLGVFELRLASGSPFSRETLI